MDFNVYIQERLLLTFDHSKFSADIVVMIGTWFVVNIS